MNHSEEIKELKVAINNLIIQNSLSMIKIDLLESLLFNIVSQSYPNELQQVFTLFVDRLDEKSKQAINGLEECCFPVDDSTFSLRQQFDHFANIARLKEDRRYQHEKEDTSENPAS